MGVGLSLFIHVGLLGLVWMSFQDRPGVDMPDPVRAVHVDLTPPPAPRPDRVPNPDPGGQAAAATSAPPVAEETIPTPTTPRPTPPRPHPPIRPPQVPPPPQVEAVAVAAPFPTVGPLELAGATTAGAGSGARAGSGTGAGSGAGVGDGSGQGGGRCDMVGRVQRSLRSDAGIVAAVRAAQQEVAAGRALLIWDGDWRQRPGEAGKGLAGVRQAIAVEVAFAPEACRRQTMRGLALITLGEAGPRLALGTGDWRWSDLLGLR